ncbi:endonuclease/exonuclease/phosphatase family protein [Vibrio sp. SM6]|uniref:Endonuclease/exonuclease/phosphatase family protein n=1 Tax=Vibrio agarilyticus TaxID=2726741 RepID=A0A7X8TR63_9VIBR|nr:endonuclease/exonuclease/phosphatase family protein [Vibrio agarilyticus]NLS13326.1 endonuclease/exonuclease/phosphatase family protein [Vibrio agarilyticus]
MKWKNIWLASCLRSCFILVTQITIASATAQDTFPQFNIAAWNMQWLSSVPSRQFEASIRSDQDYQALRAEYAPLAISVLAFQEVNDPIALQRVIGSDYRLIFSDRKSPLRRQHQFDDINQYTGFALARNIAYADPRDIVLDSRPTSKLRFASYIILFPSSAHPIHLLSIHLKAGCTGRYQKSRRACRTLKAQVQQLNQWIASREAQNQRYLLLGDFNHNLSHPKDWLWQQLSAGTEAQLVSRETPSICQVRASSGSTQSAPRLRRYSSLIDHMVGSPSLMLSDVRQVPYSIENVKQFQLSDHCIVAAKLAIESLN